MNTQTRTDSKMLTVRRPSKSKAKVKAVVGKKLAALLAADTPVHPVSKKLLKAAMVNHLPTPQEFAKETGLRYVTDTGPGIKRVGHNPKHFRYVSPAGRHVRDVATLRRIHSLVIPPAWRDVWICVHADGHIQATGIDARNRKQYRYHPDWRRTRDETKFHRMIAFGKALPPLRRRIAKDLVLPGMPREKVLAAIVSLLEKTLIRVGNEEYARENHSYGLTTLQNKHASVHGSHVQFSFRGKSGVDHSIDLDDPRLAKIVSKCQHLPGQELFAYLNGEGKPAHVSSSDVNDYLREVTGEAFTAKDFRTWNGTVLAAKGLAEIAAFDSEAQAKKNVISAVEAVAKRLGNTRSVCRKCYIHPAVIDSYMDGSLLDALAKRASDEMKHLRHWRPEEAAVLAFLQERLKRDAQSARKAG